MRNAFRRDVLAGGIAGLAGGFAGVLGLDASGTNVLLHLLLSALLGAAFGTVVRDGAEDTPATWSAGLLWGLLWWIVGPLTLGPLLQGRVPGWSLAETGSAFGQLIGSLLYGLTMGLSFPGFVRLLRGAATANGEGGPGAEVVARRRIVILGGGFGGVSTAQRLERLLVRDPDVELTLVSTSNYLLFTPMLAEVASSALEAQHISAPIRAALTRTVVRRAAAEAVDVEAQRVRVRAGANTPAEEIAYDHLVLALGSEPNFYGLPGLEEHSITLKTLADGTRLRNHVIAMLERADVEADPEERRRQLSFVVAGAGFAGTEMIAELFDLVHSVLRFYPHIDRAELRFVLVHAGDRILPELSPELGAYALHKLQARGIEFVLQTRVMGATPEAVLLGEGETIPTRTLVWTAGNQPHALLRTLPFERSRPGAVVAEATLQVKGMRNVWAVGDCAQIPDVLNAGKFHPPTAQHALREGKVVAENIVAALRGRPLKPFRFQTIGMLVVLGHRTAAAEVRGLRFSGLLAWLMWRTIYLSKLPGLEKKVRVALDWTIDLFFPRDIVLTAPTPSLSQTITAERRTMPVPSPAAIRQGVVVEETASAALPMVLPSASAD